MRVLLDTHAFLWFIEDNPLLSAKAQNLIETSKTTAFVSVASLWEIAIKQSLGKLVLREPFDVLFPDQLVKNDCTLLPITIHNLTIVGAMPFHHRDPFDRLLVSQAIVEQCSIVSRDDAIDAYGVQRIW